MIEGGKVHYEGHRVKASKEVALGALIRLRQGFDEKTIKVISLSDKRGNATLAASRRSRTTGWTVDEKLMALGDGAHLMHAMPVRRNLEVSDEVLDGERSLVYAQAANRLHSQKALLTMLLR